MLILIFNHGYFSKIIFSGNSCFQLESSYLKAAVLLKIKWGGGDNFKGVDKGEPPILCPIGIALVAHSKCNPLLDCQICRSVNNYLFPPNVSGFLMGRLRFPDQSDTTTCTGTDGHWTVFSQNLCGLLYGKYASYILQLSSCIYIGGIEYFRTGGPLV